MAETLTLQVKREYFEAIKAGTKLEEYRLVKPRWTKALEGRGYSFVIMTCGYPAWGDHAKRLVIPWRGFTRKTLTHPHFGPDPVDVYAIDVSAPPVKCAFCRNGYLGNRYGEDVECVNGVLIDIDVYHEGWDRDTILPVAPCHPAWKKQCRGEDFDNDSLERLEATLDDEPTPDGAERVHTGPLSAASAAKPPLSNPTQQGEGA